MPVCGPLPYRRDRAPSPPIESPAGGNRADEVSDVGAQSAQDLGAAVPVETDRTTGGWGRGYGVRRLARGERAELILPGPDGQPIGRDQRPRLVEAGALRAEVPNAASALAATQEAADLSAQASRSSRNGWVSVFVGFMERKVRSCPGGATVRR